MKTSTFSSQACTFSALALTLLLMPLTSCQEKRKEAPFAYPETQTVAHKDTFFGKSVPDPYRWLENDTAETVAQWVASQNEVTQTYLDAIPFKDKIRQRLTDLWNYEKYSAPFKEGPYYFFSKNDGLQNQFVLYIQESLDGEAEVFLDPNTFSADGTIALAGTSFSHDSKYFAYSTTESGSDWRTIYVMEVESRKMLTDTIRWAKFTGISWYKDGFFYSAYDQPDEKLALSSFNNEHKVYYHKLGTPQEADRLIFGGPGQAVRYANAQVTEDERFLVIYAAIRTSGNKLYLKDLAQPDAPLIEMVDNYDHDHSVVYNDGNTLYIATYAGAPNRKVVTVDASAPQAENWEDLIPEKAQVLSNVSTAGGKLFLSYLEDASTQIYQYGLQGREEKKIEFPALGTAGGFGGKKSDTEVFYTFTSFTYPPTIYRYDIQSGTSTLFRQAAVDIRPEDYETRQVFYESKDGTKVPMFIVFKKGIDVQDGARPTYLYGYGGFNISLRPSFNISRMLWLEQGGIFAMPNLRGGGEYGKAWHEAGTQMNKQNVFDDFIAAAEYLIQEGYTSREKLAIFGGSNGGLLVGACMTQRPELFKVAVPAVGVMDMLRYHKFTAGAGWIHDYGCADSSQAMFEYIYGYSPVHNVREGVSYPATLVKTADHDDRVVPAHSFKFIAELQKKHAGDSPVMIRIDTKAGHGGGKPTDKIIEELADTYAFVYQNLGETYIYEPEKAVPQKYQ